MVTIVTGMFLAALLHFCPLTALHSMLPKYPCPFMPPAGIGALHNICKSAYTRTEMNWVKPSLLLYLADILSMLWRCICLECSFRSLIPNSMSAV